MHARAYVYRFHVKSLRNDLYLESLRKQQRLALENCFCRYELSGFEGKECVAADFLLYENR